MIHVKTISIQWDYLEQPTLGQILSVVARMFTIVGTSLVSKEAEESE
ncbi:MAG TPA: hypothetical protein PKI11_13685 [Candidatus Hydrogenedentes bacterium]|nr:hypothetical protein [Candidatus Hydrogenedentota bacterium]HNT88157.1 hypothetical protein [Candidatus Hydrogenedentota bacterium]